MKRAEKEQVVAELYDKFSRVKAAVVTDYRGLNVGVLSDLRRQLREAKVEFHVVKNTLVKRASENTELSAIKDQFTGPSAVALSYEDPVAPAKILSKFAENNPKLVIRAGLVEGRALDLAGVSELAKLPGREELIAQLLSVFNGPARSFVTVLSGVQRGLVTVLDAIRKQKEEAA